MDLSVTYAAQTNFLRQKSAASFCCKVAAQADDKKNYELKTLVNENRMRNTYCSD
jgi:hypothetical protein